jgi:hypothetical protein
MKPIDLRSADIDRLSALLPHAGQRFDAVRKEIHAIRKGVDGQKQAVFHLEHEFKETDRISVIHDLRIEHGGETAQIDHLLFHRMLRRLVVVETKHFGADLVCNDHGEWTAAYPNRSYGIPSPTRQAKRHETILRRWLSACGYSSARSFSSVVLVGSRMSVHRSAAHVDDVDVVKMDNFGDWHDRKCVSAGLLYTGMRIFDYLSDEQAFAFMKEIAAAHVPEQIDWARRMGVTVPAAPAPSRKVPKDHKAQAPSDDGARGSGPEAKAAPEDSGATMAPSLFGDAMGTILPDRRTRRSFVQVDGGMLEISAYASGRRAIRCDDRFMRERLVAACREAGAAWEWQIRSWWTDAAGSKRIVRTLGGDVVRKAPSTPPETFALSHPNRIITPLGDVELKYVGNQEWAVRPEGDRRLTDAVDRVCQHIGRWQPTYDNWIVRQSELATLKAEFLNIGSRIASA